VTTHRPTGAYVTRFFREYGDALLLTVALLMILIVSLVWTLFVFSILFNDSGGEYRDPGLLGILRACLFTVPLPVACIWGLYRVWRKKP
jgi:hypothetical protein